MNKCAGPHSYVWKQNAYAQPEGIYVDEISPYANTQASQARFNYLLFLGGQFNSTILIAFLPIYQDVLMY